MPLYKGPFYLTIAPQLRTMAPSMSSPLGIDLDLTYCTVKTGVNDFLDYIALVVSLVIPLVLGPGLAGVGQVRVCVCRDPFPESTCLQVLESGQIGAWRGGERDFSTSLGALSHK